MKTISFMKLTVVTVKQSTSVNINGLITNRVQMNTQDQSGIVIVIMKLLNTARNQITTLTGITRKLLIGKGG